MNKFSPEEQWMIILGKSVNMTKREVKYKKSYINNVKTWFEKRRKRWVK